MSAISRSIIYPTPREHPGKVLRERYLDPLGLSVRRLAVALKVSRGRLDAVVNGRAGINPEMSMRLGRYFRDPPLYWLEMQVAFDVEKTYCKFGTAVDQIRPYMRW
ncbi:HigA family addiction module antitoxin [Stenotrophomonas sp.]|uniref:HigA family addiction module antitoxin n=1 Tax=Stenotrophomonas sp. TaxID=69392 RepID=UPI00289880E1|nr:HigA family addiction module antitoxin [Stenotrophomonas sp.]